MIEPRPRLAAYFRVSSQTQKNEETIHRQYENFDIAWERLKETYTLVPRFPSSNQKLRENRYFVDEGYNLEQWDEESACHDLMSRCKRGEFEAIYVSELDRICRSRSAELRGKIKDILENSDTKILTKNGEVPAGILFDVLSSVSAEDKRSIMLKCQEGKIARCEREGKPPSGKTPFGFDRNRFTREWVVVPDEARIIRCAVGLMIGKVVEEMPPELAALAQTSPGGLSDPKIADALNASNFSMAKHYERNGNRKWLAKNPTGSIKVSFLDSIFRDDRYRGSYEIRLREPKQVGKVEFKGMDRDKKRKILIKLPRIISDEEWKEIKARRLCRKVHATKRLNHEYLAREILYCGECGIRMSARPKWGKKKRKRDGGISEYAPSLYYTCNRKKKASGFRCPATRCHQSPQVDEVLWNQVKEIVLRPETIYAIQKSSTEVIPAPNIPKLEGQLLELQKKIQGLVDERKRITTYLVKELITEAEFIEQKARIETEDQSLEKSSRKLKRYIDMIQRTMDEAPAFDLEAIKSRYENRIENLRFEEKRSIVTALVKQAIIKPDGAMRLGLRQMRCA